MLSLLQMRSIPQEQDSQMFWESLFCLVQFRWRLFCQTNSFKPLVSGLLLIGWQLRLVSQSGGDQALHQQEAQTFNNKVLLVPQRRLLVFDQFCCIFEWERSDICSQIKTWAEESFWRILTFNISVFDGSTSAGITRHRKRSINACTQLQMATTADHLSEH